MKFQYFEVRPCIEVQDAKGNLSIDSFRDEKHHQLAVLTTEGITRSFWSLYGIDEEGLGIAIGDFVDKKAAHEILYAILAPMADARDLALGDEFPLPAGVIISPAERAAGHLDDVINQSSNMERV